MGKTLIVQARGKGGPRYRTPSHRYLGKVQYFSYGTFTAKVVDILNDPGHFAPVMLVKDQNGREVLHIAQKAYRPVILFIMANILALAVSLKFQRFLLAREFQG